MLSPKEYKDRWHKPLVNPAFTLPVSAFFESPMPSNNQAGDDAGCKCDSYNLLICGHDETCPKRKGVK